MCLVPLSLDCVSSGLLAWLPGMTCRLTCTTPTLHSMTVDNCWKPLCSRLFRSSCRTHLCDSLLLTLHLYMLLVSLYDNIMLQSVLNAAARLVFSARRSEHTTPLLRELHWLKVPERIQYRLCAWYCTTIPCWDTSLDHWSGCSQPPEIGQCVDTCRAVHSPINTWRTSISSGCRTRLEQPSRYGDTVRSAHSFAEFCQQLKTFLFRACYSLHWLTLYILIVIVQCPWITVWLWQRRLNHAHSFIYSRSEVIADIRSRHPSVWWRWSLFDLLNLKLVGDVGTRGTDNLPADFRVSATFRCRVISFFTTEFYF